MVLKHMQEEGPITTLKAFTEHGITRLSAKIYAIKKKGHDVKSRYITVPTRYGTEARVKEYWI
jgi:hypothetical protein